MNYEIVETVIDSAGKYRVKVILDQNTTQIFKFNYEPSQEEINIVADEYLANLLMDNNHINPEGV